ncbi:MAG: hypothetical protein R3C49_13865 [Planctomycetaceae bacterium]
MDDQTLIITALAEECCVLLKARQPSNSTLPTTLQPEHLLWMSKQIISHADDWPLTKLHRWIGYVQCGMVGNRMLDFDGARAMFMKVRDAFQGVDIDPDLIDHLDHLDPDNPFRLEIGGES